MKKYEIYRAEREKGLTYQEIADKYGVSRQRVYQACHETPRVWVKEHQCVYHGLRNYLNENDINITELANILDEPRYKVSRLLSGNAKSANMRMVAKLAELTGLTYERMFKEDELT